MAPASGYIQRLSSAQQHPSQFFLLARPRPMNSKGAPSVTQSPASMLFV